MRMTFTKEQIEFLKEFIRSFEFYIPIPEDEKDNFLWKGVAIAVPTSIFTLDKLDELCEKPNPHHGSSFESWLEEEKL